MASGGQGNRQCIALGFCRSLFHRGDWIKIQNCKQNKGDSIGDGKTDSGKLSSGIWVCSGIPSKESLVFSFFPLTPHKWMWTWNRGFGHKSIGMENCQFKIPPPCDWISSKVNKLQLKTASWARTTDPWNKRGQKWDQKSMNKDTCGCRQVEGPLPQPVFLLNTAPKACPQPVQQQQHWQRYSTSTFSSKVQRLFRNRMKMQLLSILLDKEQVSIHCCIPQITIMVGASLSWSWEQGIQSRSSVWVTGSNHCHPCCCLPGPALAGAGGRSSVMHSYIGSRFS